MPDATSELPLIGERIVVIGNTNAGKSTLAAQLEGLLAHARHLARDRVASRGQLALLLLTDELDP